MALFDPRVQRGAIGSRTVAAGLAFSFVVVASIAVLQPVARAVAQESAPRPPSSERTLAPAEVATTAPRTPVEVRPFKGPSEAKSIEAVPPASLSTPAPQAPGASNPGVGAGVPPSSEQSATSEPTPASAPVDVPAVEETPTASTKPTPSLPVIRISTDLVQIDAVVTDKSGRQVTNLAPESFEVFENGRKMPISHLAYVRTGLGPVSGDVDEVAGATGQTREPLTVVFVYDDLGVSAESAAWARQALGDFARRRVAGTDRVALGRTSHIRRGALLKWGRDELTAEAEAIRFNPWSRTTFLSPSFERAGMDGRSWFHQLAYDAIGSLKSTVNALRAVLGRKAVVLVSEGFGVLVGHDVHGFLQDRTYSPLDALYDDRGVRAALQSLTDLANRASVVIYTIDPSGLGAGGANAEASAARTRTSYLSDAAAASQGYDPRSGPVPGPAPPPAERIERLSRQESLREIADETGGLAVVDDNDLNGSLARVLDDQSGYYLLAYEPDPSTFKGRATYRKLRVEVNKRGLEVRSRRGFYSVPDDVVSASAPPTP